MKKVSTAMGNPTLNQELKRYSQFDVVGEDLFYQEAVIDFLNKEQIDVLAISGILQGQWDLIEFVSRIQKINQSLRLIIVLDEMDMELKCQLLEKNVKDIYLDEKVEIKDIVEAIEREEPLRMKLEKTIKKEEKVEKEYVSSRTVDTIWQKQEVIAICGVNGSGKSTITYNLSKIMAQKTEGKILVIDMNTLCGNIDELYGINKIPQNVEISLDIDKKCGLNYAADLVKKDRFDANVLEEIVISKDGVDILTGNTSLYCCQEMLNSSIYQAILRCAKEKYDFIILDTSSNIFLDATRWSMETASKVLFVIENDYLSIKKAEQMLNVITKNWGVWKNKISIVINKERSGFVDVDIISDILEEYKIVGRIKQNNESDFNAYYPILESFHFVPRVGLVTKLLKIKDKIETKYLKKYPENVQSVRGGIRNAN